MRELKFRAIWDGQIYTQEDQGEDYYFSFEDGGVSLNTYEQFHETGSGVAEEHWMYEIKEDAIFCQYTGLKDKNGVEIYESYKVKVKYGINNEEAVGIIEMIDGCWSVSFRSFSLKPLCPISKVFRNQDYVKIFRILGNSIQVIGNIHENPELMEGE